MNQEDLEEDESCILKFINKIKRMNNYLNKNLLHDKGNKSFYKFIKQHLQKNMSQLSNDYERISSWEQFFDVNEEKEKKISNYDYKNCSCCQKVVFLLFTIFFTLIHLIGIQEMIIILNALLNELTDELKLFLYNELREVNFYENLKIASFKDMPDIDVIMFTSFLGTTCIKNYGFIISSIFQLIPSIWFLLFFLFFSFHSEEELKKN